MRTREFLAGQAAAIKSRIGELESRLDQIDGTIARLEKEAETAPDDSEQVMLFHAEGTLPAIQAWQFVSGQLSVTRDRRVEVVERLEALKIEHANLLKEIENFPTQVVLAEGGQPMCSNCGSHCTCGSQG